MAAGRGVIALLIGDRQSAGFFDLTRRGLVTSFIALLIAAAIRAFVPIIVGANHESALVAVVRFGILEAGQLLFVAIALRQMRRIDALVAYLLASNWVTFFVILINAALFAAGIGGDDATNSFLTIIFGVVLIVLEVNIARLVMALTPMQIAILIIAELVGALLAFGLTLMVLPLPPDVAAQLNAMS